MGAIAVAGGSGQVGRALVDGLVSHKGRDIYILSRSGKAEAGGVPVLNVDYADIEGTARTLEENEVDTVICTIGLLPPRGSEAQINLIKAAASSKTTRRFVLSAFESLHRREHIETNIIAKHTFAAIDELENTDLEYTRVVNGWFLDYYGLPHWPSHMHPWINLINVEKKWAVIPGDGTAQVHFITTQDLARFVAKLQDLPSWRKVTPIIGEKLSVNELLAMAEDVRGSKFEVAHDSLESLRQGKISFADRFPDIGLGAVENEGFYALLHYQAGLGNFVVPEESSLNRDFPEIRTTTAREVLETSWMGK